MLLDHGADSFLAVFASVNAACFFSPGNNLWALSAVVIGSLPFYFATLEGYYIGGVFLGKINGVTDGSFVYIGMTLFVSFIDQNYLFIPIWNGLRFSHILSLILLLSTIGMVIQK